VCGFVQSKNAGAEIIQKTRKGTLKLRTHWVFRQTEAAIQGHAATIAQPQRGSVRSSWFLAHQISHVARFAPQFFHLQFLSSQELI
jgi:hypothetical protein